jgi:hypothetical protein
VHAVENIHQRGHLVEKILSISQLSSDKPVGIRRHAV